MTAQFDRDMPGLAALASLLSRAEACLICDALNGAMLTAVSLGMSLSDEIRFGVGDAIALDGLADKWDVDGPSLELKLQALPEDLAMALAAAVEHFWANTHLPTELALRSAGLVRCAAGHSLCPPRDTCGDCLLVRLGAA